MACPLSISLASGSEKDFKDCAKKLMLARYMMDALNGKWKLEVILCLLEYQKRRFKELQKHIPGVSSRILSSVLKDLEQNHILIRRSIDNPSIIVEYELTEYGRSMKQVIEEFIKLGIEHRREVIGK